MDKIAAHKRGVGVYGQLFSHHEAFVRFEVGVHWLDIVPSGRKADASIRVGVQIIATAQAQRARQHYYDALHGVEINGDAHLLFC